MALQSAIASGEPLLQVLAQIACALFEEQHRDEHLRSALELSERIDSHEVQHAVQSIIAGDENNGMLQPFVNRLSQSRSTGIAPLAIDMACGRVRRRNSRVALSERELALVLVLARSRAETSPAELCDLIWPDLDEEAGLHAVQTCIHRLRQRLRDPDAVQNTTHGYRLRADTVIDLFTIEQFIHRIHGNERLDQFTALRLNAVAKHLDSTRPAYINRWEWFVPIERRINELSRTAKYCLAQHALHLRKYDWALALSHQIRVRDELDEPAWHIAVRALLESGNRAEAQREFRRYREITLRELNAEPSSDFYDLLERDEQRPDLRVLR
jgi:DNA-binding SARP family transcriptional activator